MKTLDAEWLERAVEAIKGGLADKLERGNATVYKCGKIIRVDIKITQKDDMEDTLK